MNKPFIAVSACCLMAALSMPCAAQNADTSVLLLARDTVYRTLSLGVLDAGCSGWANAAGSLNPRRPICHTVPDFQEKRRRTKEGLLIGAVAGGALGALGTRLVNGKCDDGSDAWMPCEVAYAYIFVCFSLPGALVGAIVGSSIER